MAAPFQSRGGIPESAVRTQLEKVLASERFARSASLSRFLRFVVDETLLGRGVQLKEHVLGLEVFQRGESFDPRIDPIVRVQARKLRAKLREYYGSEGRDAPVRIEMPTGSYVPVFHAHSVSSYRTRRAVWWAAAAAIALVVAGAAASFFHLRRAARAESVISRIPDPGIATTPAISADGSVLVWTSTNPNQDGNLDLWARRSKDAEPVHLTSGPADDYDPSISPDNTRVVFRSDRDHGAGIYTVALDGGEPKLLAAGGMRPRFSPDGAWIAYWSQKDNNGETYIMPSAGGEAVRIQPEIGAVCPIWTRDGKHLLFCGVGPGEGHPDWWVTALDRGAKPVKTGILDIARREGLSADRYPADSCIPPGDWSPRGDRVFFSALRGNQADLWQISVSSANWQATSGPSRLTGGPVGGNRLSVSMLGQLVFSTRTTSVDLWSLPIDLKNGAPAGEPERLTRSTAVNRTPSLSADGRKLAFASNRSGNFDVWLRDLKTGQETVLATTLLQEFRPKMSADGSRVVFYSVPFQHNRPYFYLQAVSGGSAEVICQDCNTLMDWSPDGRYILYSLDARPRGVALLELGSRRKTDILKNPRFALSTARFSPDGRWITFLKQVREGSSQLLVAPFREDKSPADAEWVAVTDGSAQEDKPAWSSDGNVLYFLSDRDGTLCIWAQRLDPATKYPAGPAFPVYHSHGDNSIARAGSANLDLTVAGGRLVFNQYEMAGAIWTRRLR